jgi:cytochrome b
MQKRRLVWDLPLRLFHWLLALSIFSSWLTAEFDWMEIHFWLGYGTLGMVIFRIFWGFIGPRHARFASFLVGPIALLRHAKATLRGTAANSVGHNPLGGLSVIVLLALVIVQAVTGLFTTDDVIWAGVYNAAVSSRTGDYLSGLHHRNFNRLLAMICLHLIAIAYYWLIKKQNLVSAMVTGTKSAEIVPPHEEIAGSALLRALIAILISSAAIYWLVSAAPQVDGSSF